MLAVNQRSNFDPGSKIPLFEAIQPSKWNNRFIRSYVTRGSVQVSLTHIGAPLSRTNAGRVSIFSIYCLHLPRPRTKGDASKNFTSATWKKGMDEKERQCGWQKEKEKRGGGSRRKFARGRTGSKIRDYRLAVPGHRFELFLITWSRSHVT